MIALHEAILACRNGGTVSVVGVYTGLIDKFPMNAVMNRSLTIRSGQCHVQRYMQPLLERIQNGDIDPTFVITQRLPLEQATEGYKMFNDKIDGCEKVVLKAAWGSGARGRGELLRTCGDQDFTAGCGRTADGGLGPTAGPGRHPLALRVIPAHSRSRRRKEEDGPGAIRGRLPLASRQAHSPAPSFTRSMRRLFAGTL